MNHNTNHPSEVKPVKAWAVVDTNNEIVHVDFDKDNLEFFKALDFTNGRIFEVEIHPITKESNGDEEKVDELKKENERLFNLCLEHIEYVQDKENELSDLKEKLSVAVEALRKIANKDYRGNRSPMSVEAFHVLARINSIKEGGDK